MCASETVIHPSHYTLHTELPPDYDTTFFPLLFSSVYLFIIILANNTAHWEVERETLAVVAVFCVMPVTDSCDDSV